MFLFPYHYPVVFIVVTLLSCFYAFILLSNSPFVISHLLLPSYFCPLIIMLFLLDWSSSLCPIVFPVASCPLALILLSLSRYHYSLIFVFVHLSLGLSRCNFVPVFLWVERPLNFMSISVPIFHKSDVLCWTICTTEVVTWSLKTFEMTTIKYLTKCHLKRIIDKKLQLERVNITQSQWQYIAWWQWQMIRQN